MSAQPPGADGAAADAVRSVAKSCHELYTRDRQELPVASLEVLEQHGADLHLVGRRLIERLLELFAMPRHGTVHANGVDHRCATRASDAHRAAEISP